MRTSLVCLLGAFALVFSTAMAGEGDCDIKTVVKMRYCENDDLVLEKTDLVSDVIYYECEECEGHYEKPGDCPDCEESKLVKKKSGKNACKHCLGETIEVEVCVKDYYVCPECGTEAAAAGSCPDCEKSVALEKDVVRAVIHYVCEDCGTTHFTPGKCTATDCEGKGKALVRRCSQSGSFPHTR